MALIQRIIAGLLGLLFVAGVIVFASLALGVLLAVALVGWGWLWWRTRGKLDRRPHTGVVVEGEYREVPPSQLEARDKPLP
jgi:hypothetical protein